MGYWENLEASRRMAEHIRQMCYRMKPGEHLRISRWEFQEAFPVPFRLFSDYDNSVQVFLSSMMGSIDGWIRVHQEIENPDGDYIITCHEHSEDKRYYVDPDRQHMFDRHIDGTLTLKDEYKIKGEENENNDGICEG